MVKRGHDQKRDEADRCKKHDDLLNWPLLRCRTAAHATLEKRRISFHKINGSERGRAEEYHQINPCLPISYGPSRDEQEKAHHNRKHRQGQPRSGAQIVHVAIAYNLVGSDSSRIATAAPLMRPRSILSKEAFLYSR